jgi:protein disulfide-isomerase A6
MFFLSLFSAALVATATATASNVVELTPSNFDEVVGKGKPALVELFASFNSCSALDVL